MKTLLIGYYDYEYYSSAVEIVDGKMKKKKLKEDIIGKIYDNISPWTKEKKDVSVLLNKYDHVIVCVDGDFIQLK